MADWLRKEFSLLHKQAQDAVAAEDFEYVDGGVGDEHTLRKPLADITCTLLGDRLSAPLIIAPMAMHKLMHENGEHATASAAEKCNIPMCLTMMSSYDMESIKQNGCKGILYQQYSRHKPFMKMFLEEVYKNGCRCLVITVDSAVYVETNANKRNGFNWSKKPISLISKKYLANYCDDPLEVFNKIEEREQWLEWEMISWIKQTVDVKVVLKLCALGILSAEDAALAVEHGVDAIVVSNHGGRQLDGTVTASDVLPSIAAAVNRRIPIIADGGIQRGTDILKALSMGASVVMIGRPILYALAAGGADRVEAILQDLKKELAAALSLCGCTSVADVHYGLLYRRQ